MWFSVTISNNNLYQSGLRSFILSPAFFLSNNCHKGNDVHLSTVAWFFTISLNLIIRLKSFLLYIISLILIWVAGLEVLFNVKS